MTTLAARPSRRRSALARVTRWVKLHPLLAYVLAMAAGTIIGWACEYATGGGVAAALCHLWVRLHDRLGTVIEQFLRRPLES